jgi:two-component system, cell cycle response regulator DivK
MLLNRRGSGLARLQACGFRGKFFALANETILVVDDNCANLSLTRVLLDKAGYRTYGAHDAEVAIKLLASEAAMPHLILMDIHLPGMDGLALTKVLKTDPSTREITIVAITGYAMKGEEARARAAGCDDLIAKPVSSRTLLAIVAYHLAKRSPLRPLAVGLGIDEPSKEKPVRPSR